MLGLMLLFLGMLLLGCSSSETDVLLLDNGKVENAVIVSTNKGEQRLDRVGSFVSLRDKNEPPSPPKVMPADEIAKRFGKILVMVPPKPVSYMLYFQPNSTELTPSSKKTLEEALKSIKMRQPCTVDIIGHTDTVGSSEVNVEISLKRARYIKSLIQQHRLKVVAISAKGYGEEDLQVPTRDNTQEEKNRNVEIFIK